MEHLIWMLVSLLTAVQATYYSWPSRWQEQRSGEDIYPGTFLGEGSAVWNRGYAELTCALHAFEGYVVSNVVWSKLRGDYEDPIYPCPQCYPMHDFRIRTYDHHGKSILMVRDPGPMDRGTYRCTATAQHTDGTLTTVYQVVNL